MFNIELDDLTSLHTDEVGVYIVQYHRVAYLNLDDLKMLIKWFPTVIKHLEKKQK